MTNQQHPITPPPELVRQWEGMPRSLAFEAAYRAGADQELEACAKEVSYWSSRSLAEKLRAARRPKPPSLKEQALAALTSADGADHPVVATVLTADQHAIIRRALEQLDD